MNRKELTKTFMMISNKKKHLLAIFFTNQLGALRVNIVRKHQYNAV